MHLLLLSTALLPLLSLADHPIRMQGFRGREPSPQMAQALAESMQRGNWHVKDVVPEKVEEEFANVGKGVVEELKHGKHEKGKKAKGVKGGEGDGGKRELDPRNWDDYPPCAKICTPPGLEASGCNFPDDVWCMCRCSLFGNPVGACEEKECSKEDISAIHELGGKMCEPVGGFQPKVDSSCKKPVPKEGLKE